MTSRPAAVDATEQTTAARCSSPATLSLAHQATRPACAPTDSPTTPSRPATLDTTEPGAWVAHALLLAGAASVWLATMVDLLDGGLGSSNGKLVSIFDSVDGCRGFRKQRPVQLARMDSRPPTSRRGSLYHVAAQLRKGRAANLLSAGSIVVLNLLNKFGPATVVSLLTRSTPVIFQGWRHSLTFLASLAAIQLSWRDLAFRAATSPYFDAALALSSALYKLRKVVFIHGQGGALWLASLLTWLVVDGGSDLRRLTNYATTLQDCFHRGDLALSARTMRAELLEARRATGPVVLKAALPNVACAYVLRRVPNETVARLVVLAYLGHRYRALPALRRAADAYRDARSPLPGETPPTPVRPRADGTTKKAR